MDGNYLDQIIGLTGLPEDRVTAWIQREMQARGMDFASLNEATLRELLTDMIQELILSN